MLQSSAVSRLITLLAAVIVAGAPASAQVPSPTIEGPITAGAGIHLLGTTTFDLAEVGYEQAEYFISGTASAFVNVGPLESHGRWTVAPGETAPFKTRIVVYRPIKKKKFNGTVIVEWLNVSGGLDAAPDWIMAHTELIRSGYAWVGVSAQIVGIEPDQPAALPGLPSLPAKVVDPVRYASLSHPGDSFSYDIFSQAGQAILGPQGSDPLGNLKVKRLIAVGESQSAFRLTTYVNGIHPIAGIYNGFFIHSRGGALLSENFGSLSQPPQPSIPPPSPSLIRTDVETPVLTLETETDLTLLAFINDRQPDSKYFRLWEVAGTAHADTYTTVVGMTDLGKDPRAADLVITTRPLDAGGAGVPGLESIDCPKPINSGPHHFVVKAAIAALNRWAKGGKAPARAPRLETTTDPLAIVRDERGNALGGIRTPQLEVPIATYSGEGQTGSLFCLLFGTTTPFDSQTLASLYSDHRPYVKAFKKAAKKARRSGFLLKKDVKLMNKSAQLSSIGR